jgi:hypothetical protein
MHSTWYNDFDFQKVLVKQDDCFWIHQPWWLTQVMTLKYF